MTSNLDKSDITHIWLPVCALSGRLNKERSAAQMSAEWQLTLSVHELGEQYDIKVIIYTK